MRRSHLLLSAAVTLCSLIAVVCTLFVTNFTGLSSTRAASIRQIGQTWRQAKQPDSDAHYAMTRQAITPNTTYPPLQYHGGPVMQSGSTTYAIFWEPATLQDGTSAYVSPTYNSLIQQYFNDVGGSSLYNITTQYYETPGGHIVNSSTFGGAWVDNSPFPASGCTDSFTPGDCLSDKQIRAEILNAMAVNGWSGGLNSMFFFFTPKGEGTCKNNCAFTNYCAYHTHFTSNNVNILYADIPYEGTDPTGCASVPASPNNDIDADSSITFISHEHMEGVTDPLINAWKDAYGNEIGDNCDFQFGTLNLDGGLANVQWNGHYYIVQQEYSNAISGCAIARSVAGTVYSGSDDNSLYAINANDGTPAGSYTTGNSVVSSPTVVNGVAYVGSNDNSVYAFSTSNGTTLWSYPTGGPISSSPTVANGVVYVGSSDGYVYALNATTGHLVWRYLTGGPVTSSPVVSNFVVYIGSSDHYLYALKTAHGVLLWRFATGGVIDARPLVFNKLVYVGSNDDTLYAVNLTGTQVASYLTSGAISRSSPVALAPNIYIGSSDGNVYALNMNTLSLVWQYSIGSPVLSTPAIANKVVYVGASDGYVYALDAITDALHWRQQIGTNIVSSAKVIDGILFIGSNDDNVYALWSDDGTVIWKYLTNGVVESSPAVVLTSY